MASGLTYYFSELAHSINMCKFPILLVVISRKTEKCYIFNTVLGGIIVRNFISVFVYKVIDGCEYDAARSSTVLVFTYT